MIYFFLLTSVFLLLVSSYLYFLYSKSKKKIRKENEELILLNKKVDKLNDDRTKLENEKIHFEEKNRKLWSMSETVHKQKHKVDEQNEYLKLETEKLQSEKEKLQIDKTKVDEKIKKLWQQSTAIHKEKEKINQLKLEVEFKHKEIVDSVNYAKRIQEAILPPIEDISAFFKDSFVLFKPRDIVSGDFYWFYQKDDIGVIAVCDCTGHGVPGAFMSMIGNTLLNQIIVEKGNTSPSKILHLLNDSVQKALKQTREGAESRDGMDVALCVINKRENKLKFAGANRSLYVFDKTMVPEFTEFKASKFPIGGHDFEGKKFFTEIEVDTTINRHFYLFSDGLADQFGGPKGKKYMLKNLQRTLEEFHDLPFNNQKKEINSKFENWKEGYDQVDDVLLIGFKV